MDTSELIAHTALDFARSSLALAEVDEIVVNAPGARSPWDGRETWIATVRSGARSWLIKVKVGEDGEPHPSLLKAE